MYGVLIWIGEVDYNAVPYYKETIIAERFGAGCVDAEENLCRASITHIQPLVRVSLASNRTLLKSAYRRAALSTNERVGYGNASGGKPQKVTLLHLDQASAIVSFIEPGKKITSFSLLFLLL